MQYNKVDTVYYYETDQIYQAYAIFHYDYLTLTVHHFDRYVAPKTELWLFGTGLADEVIMKQLGISFLMLTEEHDPCLGKIGISLGSTRTAFVPWKLDCNIWWAWTSGEVPLPSNWFKNGLEQMLTKPQFVLCPSNAVEEKAKENGFETLFFPFGVGSVFKPLGFERKGLGYAGNVERSREQYEMMVFPFGDNVEWCRKKVDDPVLELIPLNEWYNKKQVLLGVTDEGINELDVATNNTFEILASGTPLVTSCRGINNMSLLDYPYVSDSKEKTVALVNEILNDYPRALVKFAEYSRIIREKHSYAMRLETLFKWLEEIKCG